MNYILYKTTNLLDGTIYIGAHKTKSLNDKYLGSGNLIKRAIKKYGRKNFKKIIIAGFLTEEDMYFAERLIVTEEFVKLETNYNLVVGGNCPSTLRKGKRTGKPSNSNTTWKKGNIPWNAGKSHPNRGKTFVEMCGEDRAETIKAIMKLNRAKQIITEDTKKKISNSLSGRKRPLMKPRISKWNYTKIKYVNTNDILTLDELCKKYNFKKKVILSIIRGKTQTDRFGNKFEVYKD